MTDNIRIWEVLGPSDAAVPVQPVTRSETEDLLEDILAANPQLLMRGLSLIGRQTPIADGALDLLGVDEDGRLVVLELKRETLTRHAVAQVIDYASHLESLTDADLADLIQAKSGRNGIDKIADFQQWYVERHGEQLDALRPVRMLLVGLGADDRAHRMVKFLNERGVDISLLTFHGYEHGDSTFLARRIDGGPATPATRAIAATKPARLRALDERARELGIERLWRDATNVLGSTFSSEPTGSGITFGLPTITLEGQNVRGSHSVTLLDSGKIRVTFFPAAVHLCAERFEQSRSPIPFQQAKPPNAPPTTEVSQQWYCSLNSHLWETHRDALATLANDVHAQWTRRRVAPTKQ